MDVLIFILFFAAALCFAIEWASQTPKAINTPLGLLFCALGFMGWVWWASNHLGRALGV